MVSKFVGALKCFFKRPADSMRIMMSMGTRDPRAVEAIKTHCPDIDVESVGFYAGIFLAVVFLVFCMLAYVMSLFYGAGGI